MLILLLPTMALNTVGIARGGQWRQSIGRFWLLALHVSAGSSGGVRSLIVTNPAPYKALLALALFACLNVQRLGLPQGWAAKRPRAGMAFSGLSTGLLA